MKKSILHKPFFWIAVFCVIFLLSQDFYAWSNAIKLGLFGLPTWLYWFFMLQFLFVLAMYIFSKTFWKDEKLR